MTYATSTQRTAESRKGASQRSCSRPRSLPVLAKVLKIIDRERIKARLMRDHAEVAHAYHDAERHGFKVCALNEVHKMISEELTEAPEGIPEFSGA